MKNIYLIPTDKPSRLYSKDDNHILDTTMAIDWYITSACYKPHNIYITSDEKFNRDEYVTDGVEVIKATPKLVDAQGLVDRRDWKKIILTTDQDLIKDGVQAIDDEFLEWFVKNPSCEEVEVEDYNSYGVDNWKYLIDIPKEEPKQETLEEAAERLAKHFNIDFIEGAKWQQEQDKNKYSGQEVFNLLMELSSRDRNSYSGTPHNIAKWFEQFKKK